MKGIDISNWQNGLIISKMNIDFSIAKATEGLHFVDNTCDGFIQDCIANNILWGFYHFARENDPEKEAQYFYDNCKNYFGKGIPVLDYEVENYNNVAWCENFLQKLYELSGVWGMIYLSASRCCEYENSWIPEKCGLWVAGYPSPMTQFTNEDCPYNVYPWKFAAIWQFTSDLILPGYVGRLDGDIAYMDKTAWMKYAQSKDNPQNVETPANGTKTFDEIVRDTINGKYGSGKARKKALGNIYSEVQKRVNELYKVADDVIAGKWGNGWNRKNALEGAGYPYDLIQKIVNDKCD